MTTGIMVQCCEFVNTGPLPYTACFFPCFHSNTSQTLAFENRKNIQTVVLSPNGATLLTIDEGTVG
jgi:hypothetical protein